MPEKVRIVRIVSVAATGTGLMQVVGRIGDRQVDALFRPDSFIHLPTREQRQEFVARQLLALAEHEKQTEDVRVQPPGCDLVGTVRLKEKR